MNNLPKSPVTLNLRVRNCETVRVDDIVRLYKQQECLDVHRFFNQREEIAILECEDTGYRFYYPFETSGDLEFYQQLGSNAAKSGSDYDRDWSDDHSIAQDFILPSDSLLEIGCNTGKFLSRISASTRDVQGLEYNELAADEARAKGLVVFNTSIEDYADERPGSHDIVCAFQVLEHVTMVQSFINASLKTLRPGGRLIFSVPNNDPYFQRFNKYEVMNLPPHHVGLWNLEVFQKLGSFFDMDLIDHGYSGPTSFKGDVYLRAKWLSKIKTPPRYHTTLEKGRLFAIAPIALLGSTLDHFRGIRNFGHITVAFRKRSN